MRWFLAMFFISSFPVLLFTGVFLFGGVNETTIKQELSKANIYSVTIEQLQTQSNQPENQQENDTTMNSFMNSFTGFLSPEYLQQKTETFIDDTSLWLNNKSSSSPELSFAEIKQKILLDNPDLLNQVKQSIAEMEAQQKQMAAEDPNSIPQGSFDAGKQINKFIDSDFSISMKDPLLGVKTALNILKISFYISVLLSLISLLFIILKTKELAKKLSWTGIILLISGVLTILLGFGSFALMNIANENITIQSQGMAKVMLPIFLNLAQVYIASCKSISLTTGSITAVIGFVLFLFSFIPATHTLQPVQKKVIKK